MKMRSGKGIPMVWVIIAILALGFQGGFLRGFGLNPFVVSPGVSGAAPSGAPVSCVNTNTGTYSVSLAVQNMLNPQAEYIVNPIAVLDSAGRFVGSGTSAAGTTLPVFTAVNGLACVSGQPASTYTLIALSNNSNAGGLVSYSAATANGSVIIPAAGAAPVWGYFADSQNANITMVAPSTYYQAAANTTNRSIVAANAPFTVIFSAKSSNSTAGYGFNGPLGGVALFLKPSTPGLWSTTGTFISTYPAGWSTVPCSDPRVVTEATAGSAILCAVGPAINANTVVSFPLTITTASQLPSDNNITLVLNDIVPEITGTGVMYHTWTSSGSDLGQTRSSHVIEVNPSSAGG